MATETKRNPDKLNVVFGYKFESKIYDTEKLKLNIEKMFQCTVDAYNKSPNAIIVELNFRPIAAIYVKHQFNEITQDIIPADIAVFDTSDFNPNVMLEMGVVLTWGVRFLPIKEENCKNPPSDISDQTCADYKDSASQFKAPDHHKKLIRMVDHAVRKKGKI